MKIFPQTLLTLSLFSLTACQTNQTVNESKPIGYAPDANGCNAAAGLSYSQLLEKCIQPWDIATLKLSDPDNSTAAVYIIVAADASKAEVFAVDSREHNALLQPVKGGFANTHYRLIKTTTGWQFQRTMKKSSL